MRLRLFTVFSVLVLAAVNFGCVPQKEDEKSVQPGGDVAVAGKVDTAEPKEAVNAGIPDDNAQPGEAVGSTVGAKGAKTVQAPVPAEEAPLASARIADAPAAKDLADKLQTYYSGRKSDRLHIQVDKPIYSPGETIWLRVWGMNTDDLKLDTTQTEMEVKLLSPQGSPVSQVRIAWTEGVAHHAFDITAGMVGGEYTILAKTTKGEAKRPVFVNAFVVPRIKKDLEFVKKAYGQGDMVTADLELKDSEGKPMANKTVSVVARVDGEELPRGEATTNGQGNALVSLQLPELIEVGDGLLTVMVQDSGITESVSKRIPIVVKKLKFDLYPEGGELVRGLESRVYFEARRPIGKPADVEGRVVDDRGEVVTTFASVRDGLGRFSITPEAGRSYRAEITQPAGIAETFTLPDAAAAGCVMRSYDDLDGAQTALRVVLNCTKGEELTVVAVQNQKTLDSTTVAVVPGTPTVVYLESAEPSLAKAMGVARVTAFDKANKPLVERVVFRNRRARLAVEVKPDKESYGPREKVTLQVAAKDLSGEPVVADLALSVVDDAVVAYADDKTGNMLSALLLEPEVQGDIEDPNFYFDLTEEKSGMAMELLMGTKGYRRFEWREVFDPTPPEPTMPSSSESNGPKAMPVPAGMPPQPVEGAQPVKVAELAPPQDAAPMPVVAAEAKEAEAPKREEAAADMPMAVMEPDAEVEDVLRANIAGGGAKEEKWDAGKMAKRQRRDFNEFDDDMRWQPQLPMAPVRVFPQPDYSQEQRPELRTDFRQTVLWAPSVKTDASGAATVSFFLNDSVTSFRVFAEGGANGLLGREEKTFSSNLPFSMSAKIPSEVSAGDRIDMPVTLSNATEGISKVNLTANFADILTPQGDGIPSSLELLPVSSQSLFFPLLVSDVEAMAKIRFSASAGDYADAFERDVSVVPLGFPESLGFGGSLGTETSIEVDVRSAVPGSIKARIAIEVSPTGTLLEGMAGMLQQPGGCFEQTSSSNYPNVMVLDILNKHGLDDPEVRTRALDYIDAGYKRLTGFEVPGGGYEWFGAAPSHPMLTAYGILEFTDMKAVYSSVYQTMLDRTATWLMSRRDGEGGFKGPEGHTLHTWSAAPQVTGAYIVYALTEAGYAGELQTEIEAQAKAAKGQQDPYLLALATLTLFNVPERRAEALEAAALLAKLQQSDGGWTTAATSAVDSTGPNLYVETSALALMAMMEAGNQDAVARGVAYLLSQRQGYGRFGATQATVLALMALKQYASTQTQTENDGVITVELNGEKVADLPYSAKQLTPLVAEGLGANFKVDGPNTIVLRKADGTSMPDTLTVDYRTPLPNNSELSPVVIETKLEKSTVAMGSNVQLTATITNRTKAAVPMTIARIGFPGGLETQKWQLKELKEAGTAAFVETTAREAIVYFYGLEAEQTITVPLELTAVVPGHYTGPASRTYLYYGDTEKTWAAPLAIEITQ